MHRCSTWAAAIIGVLAAMPAVAQETPTEREAAREVLQRMEALQKTLDVPAMVARTASNVRRKPASSKPSIR